MFRRKQESTSEGFSARLHRALTQRIYLLAFKKCSEKKYEFQMVGLTSNYILKIQKNKKLKCSCFDCAKQKNLCKHLINLLVKVLHISPALVELNMFQVTEDYLVGCEIYLISKEPRAIEQDDDCAICLENLIVTKEALVACFTCRKSLHKDCFDKCFKFQNKCVYCRSEWLPITTK